MSQKCDALLLQCVWIIGWNIHSRLTQSFTHYVPILMLSVYNMQFGESGFHGVFTNHNNNNWFSQLYHDTDQVRSQLVNALGSTSIRYPSYAEVSGRCLIDIDSGGFAIWVVRVSSWCRQCRRSLRWKLSLCGWLYTRGIFVNVSLHSVCGIFIFHI